jgi:DNA-binding transcriptional LysR family regulator
MLEIGTMARTGPDELEAAVAVARHRNFRAAAAELGMSPTAISSIIRNLEARIGVLLFNRTTRSVAVTSAGEAFISLYYPRNRHTPAALRAFVQLIRSS